MPPMQAETCHVLTAGGLRYPMLTVKSADDRDEPRFVANADLAQAKLAELCPRGCRGTCHPRRVRNLFLRVAEDRLRVGREGTRDDHLRTDRMERTMDILPEGAFRAAVRNEVVRALRYSHWFSVISVNIPPSESAEGLTRQAVAALASSIRESDAVGRLKDFRLGVLLLHAEERNAHAIMRRIQGELMKDPVLGEALSVLGESALRKAVFPLTAHDADTMFRQLERPERWEGDDNDEGPGPAPVGARV